MRLRPQSRTSWSTSTLVLGRRRSPCLSFISLLFFLGYCQEQGRRKSRVSLPVCLRACVGRVQGACTCWCPFLCHIHTHTLSLSLSLSHTNAFHQRLFNALSCACSARTYVHAHGHVCVRIIHTHTHTHTLYAVGCLRGVHGISQDDGQSCTSFCQNFVYFFEKKLPRYIARRRQSCTSFCLRSPHRLHTLQQLMRSTISSTRYVLCVCVSECKSVCVRSCALVWVGISARILLSLRNVHADTISEREGGGRSVFGKSA